MAGLKKWFDKMMDAYVDSVHLDRFARTMGAKLKLSRAKGRGGWQSDEATDEQIAKNLVHHITKGDPVDVANFCMFLHQRDADPEILKQALENYVVERIVPYLRENAEQPRAE